MATTSSAHTTTASTYLAVVRSRGSCRQSLVTQSIQAARRLPFPVTFSDCTPRASASAAPRINTGSLQLRDKFDDAPLPWRECPFEATAEHVESRKLAPDMSLGMFLTLCCDCWPCPADRAPSGRSRFVLGWKNCPATGIADACNR